MLKNSEINTKKYIGINLLEFTYIYKKKCEKYYHSDRITEKLRQNRLARRLMS